MRFPERFRERNARVTFCPARAVTETACVAVERTLPRALSTGIPVGVREPAGQQIGLVETPLQRRRQWSGTGTSASNASSARQGAGQEGTEWTRQGFVPLRIYRDG
jgi:hypothetical protein